MNSAARKMMAQMILGTSFLILYFRNPLDDFVCDLGDDGIAKS